MVMASGAAERDYRSRLSRKCETTAIRNPDLLNITAPEIIRTISKSYAEAGADILTTNTFGSNSLIQQGFGLESYAGEMAARGAAICREVAESYEKDSGRRIYVAGAIGPTGHLLSPPYSGSKECFDAFTLQIRALLGGGADIILIESVMDLNNMGAAISACENVMKEIGFEFPVMVSAIPRDMDGNLFDGTSPTEFSTSASGYSSVVSIGYNCGRGVRSMYEPIKHLSSTTDLYISCHPNAGTSQNKERREDATEFFEAMTEMLQKVPINIIGGCCGTTPEHIRKLRPIRGETGIFGAERKF